MELTVDNLRRILEVSRERQETIYTDLGVRALIKAFYDNGFTRESVTNLFNEVRVQYLDEGQEEDSEQVNTIHEYLDGLEGRCHPNYWLWPGDLNGKDRNVTEP